MGHKTRLGPIAIFLTIVTMVITTLAILTVATSNADRIMAGRFAAVTQTRFELEAQGEEFLARAAEGDTADMVLSGEVTTAGGNMKYETEKDGYRLEVEITRPDAGGSFEVNTWKLTKIWKEQDPMQNIWQGF